MTNMYAGMGADDRPAAPYQVTGAVPGGNGRGVRGKGTRRLGTRVPLLLAVCAAVGGGAFVVVQSAAGSPSPTASPTAGMQTVGAPAGSAAGQAAVLREVLTATGIRRLAWLRRLGGMYGQYTFETRQGPHTLAFERGTIASVAGSDVVVHAADGTTWTWTLTGTSVIRENGTKEPASALAHGEVVFAGGLVTSGTRNARLIVIRKAAATGETSGTA